MEEKSQSMELFVPPQQPAQIPQENFYLLGEIGAEIALLVEEACSLDATPKNVGEIKRRRAELHSRFDDLEKRRKEFKDRVMEPYTAVEEVYNVAIARIYKDGDAKLKAAIDIVENAKKADRANALLEWCNEYIASLGAIPDISTLEPIWMPVMKLSTSEKKLREEAKSNIDRIVSDLAAMSKMDVSVECEWWGNGCNLALAISVAEDRKRREEAISKSRSGVEYPEPEKTECEPAGAERIFSAPFTVRGTMKQIRSLKKFMEENGIEFKSAKGAINNG